MKYEVVFGKHLKLEIEWQRLHLIYGVLAWIARFIPNTEVEFHNVVKQVEQAFRQKVANEEEAKMFRLCSRCYKEIDLKKDDFKHTQYESGYEEWHHRMCPAVNKGKGYEND